MATRAPFRGAMLSLNHQSSNKAVPGHVRSKYPVFSAGQSALVPTVLSDEAYDYLERASFNLFAGHRFRARDVRFAV